MKRSANYLVWLAVCTFIVAFVALVATPNPGDDTADYYPPLCEHPDLCGVCMYKNPFRESQVAEFERELREKRRKAADRDVQPFTRRPRATRPGFLRTQ